MTKKKTKVRTRRLANPNAAREAVVAHLEITRLQSQVANLQAELNARAPVEMAALDEFRKIDAKLSKRIQEVAAWNERLSTDAANAVVRNGRSVRMLIRLMSIIDYLLDPTLKDIRLEVHNLVRPAQ